MTSPVIKEAIKANLNAMTERLRQAAVIAAEACEAMDKGEQNLAIGTALPIDDMLSQARALYDAAFALHKAR